MKGGRGRIIHEVRVMTETFMVIKKLKKNKNVARLAFLEAVMSKSDCMIITGGNKNRFLDSTY